MLTTEKIIDSIRKKAELIGRPLRFMELCGTHSGAIAEYGIKQILPKNIKLISGPGCPVCVTDQEDVDMIVGLALSGIPIAAYGDSVSVPGNIMSLEVARQRGADVSVVYDIAEALEIKEQKPNLVFWGIGFETTTPMTAWGIKKGLTVFSSHKLFPPAMAALLSDREIKVDGFINPGHVSAIIGERAYKKFKFPQVIAGFSEEGILIAIDMLLGQIIRKERKVQNAYSLVVKKEGNKKALAEIDKYFTITDSKWRGLGIIKKSGLAVREKYKDQDARYLYRDLIKKIKSGIKPKLNACQCGLVLRGKIAPADCPLYKKVCTPDRPQGACMVSVEGACNVDYRYNKQ